MNFEYEASVIAVGDGEYGVILRPMIPITVRGPNGTMELSALVDTGSDHTIFPAFVAKELGISLHRDQSVQATAFGGALIELNMGTATLLLQSGHEVIQWTDMISFVNQSGDSDDTAVLGHAGFLNYFTATFDGLAGRLTLVANDDLPSLSDEEQTH